jgi:hypothetical protein
VVSDPPKLTLPTNDCVSAGEAERAPVISILAALTLPLSPSAPIRDSVRPRVNGVSLLKVVLMLLITMVNESLSVF